MRTERPETGSVPGGRQRLFLYVLVAFVFCMLVFGFTVKLPFMCDDFHGYASVVGDRYYPPKDKYFYNFYDYLDPNRERLDPQVIPWWTSLDMKLLFFRPLTSLTVKWEVEAWGKNPAPLHLTNVILLGLVAGFLVLIGRQLFHSNEAGLLGGLIFATHLGNTFVVPWVAERASLLSMFFGIGGLSLHILFRRRGQRRWEVLAWLCFILSFLSRESGAICLISYFLYDLFVWRRESPERWPGFIRLVLYYALLCIPLGLFVLHFSAMGYGVHGYYSIVDGKTPLFQVALYIAKNVFLYAFALLYFAVIGNETNLELFHNPLYATLFLVFAACTVVLFFPGVRKKLFEDPAFHFLGSWIAVSLLPIIYLLTQNRYQFPATAPFALFMGAYILAIVRAKGFGRFTRLVGAFLVVFYVVFPPTLITIKRSTFHKVFNTQTNLVKETQALLKDSKPPVNVFYLNLPSPLYLMALQFAFDYYLGKGTTRVFPLTIQKEAPEVTLLGDRSLVVTAHDKPFLESIGERLFMSNTDVVNVEGRTWTNVFFETRVEKVIDGHIFALRFDFQTPVDDPTMRFFYVNAQDRRVYPYRFHREQGPRAGS